jgi:anti-sigma regulatory factor (Ser/Thr protein kinase)
MTNTKAASPLAAPAPDDGSPAAAICTRTFAGRPESVSAARSWVAGFFPVPAVSADAALMTSELVTNAILYSASRLPGGQVTVSVGSAGGALRVDVLDQGEIVPRIAAPCGLGLGLALVEALADASGADGRDRWFELQAGGA